MREIRNLAGQQFGKWTVLQEAGVTENKDRLWLCRCECGLTKPVKAMYLLAGSSRQCVSCGQKPKPYQEELGLPFWNRIVKGARRRGIKVLVTKQEAYEVFKKQNGKCALSGLEICLPRYDTDIRDKKVTASLDRIDGTKDYTLNNIQWLHKDVNRMKNIFNEKYFVKICKLVSKM